MKRLLWVAATILMLVGGTSVLWAACNSMSSYSFGRPGFSFFRRGGGGGTVAIYDRKTREERIALTKKRIEAMADLKAQADARSTELRRNRLEEQFDRAYDLSPAERERIAIELYERGQRSERTNVEAAKDYYLFAFQMAPGTEVSQKAHDALKRLDGPAGKPRGQGVPEETLLSQEELKDLRDRFQQASGGSPEAEAEVLRLLQQLDEIPNERSQRLVIDRLRDQQGNTYSDGLARAIRVTSGPTQDYARQALVERFQRLTSGVLLSKLRSSDEEVQLAAAQAAATKADLTAGLIELIDKSDRVSQAARKSLKALTSEDFGPAAGASTVERFAARQRWERWARQQ
jgi:hypothetical protein